MVNITDEEIQLLETAYTWDSYCDACNTIKKRHGGHYPQDWWSRVKEPGLLDRVLARFGLEEYNV